MNQVGPGSSGEIQGCSRIQAAYAVQSSALEDSEKQEGGAMQQYNPRYVIYDRLIGNFNFITNDNEMRSDGEKKANKGKAEREDLTDCV